MSFKDLQHQRRYKAANRKRLNEQERARRKKNLVSAHAYEKQWRKQNPDKVVNNRSSFLRSRPLYLIWQSMKQRCLNPNAANYHLYGDRGITIYEPWIKDYNSFANYIIEVLGPRPTPEYTLDRINNNEGYYPGNLRWATKSEQQRNKNPFTRKKTCQNKSMN